MRYLSIALLLAIAGCGGLFGDKVGTADVTSDEVNGVDASAAKFAFFAGVASNNLDIDNDGADDDSTAVVIIVLSDVETFCTDLEEGFLTGNNDSINLNGLEGTTVPILAVKRALNSTSNLLLGEDFTGDGVDVTVTMGFNVIDGGVILAQTEGDDLGTLNLTANDDQSFNGDFDGLMITDSSGQAAFDLDTDGDGTLDATSISANISGSFKEAKLCSALEGIAVLLSIFAGL